MMNARFNKRGPQRVIRTIGFTMIELVVVIAIILIVGALAVPFAKNALAMSRLQGSATDFGNLLQETRISAIKDNRIYSVRINNATTPAEAYIDNNPQNADGTAGDGQYESGEPVLVMGSDVSVSNIGAAPDTDNLDASVSSGLSLTDGNDVTSGTPVTFTPRGLPCTSTTSPSACANTNAVSFAVFFQSTTNSSWAAVTVTPAGRVQVWHHPSADSGQSWSKQ